MAPMSRQEERGRALYSEAVQRLRRAARSERDGTMVAERLHPPLGEDELGMSQPLAVARNSRRVRRHRVPGRNLLRPDEHEPRLTTRRVHLFGGGRCGFPQTMFGSVLLRAPRVLCKDKTFALANLMNHAPSTAMGILCGAFGWKSLSLCSPVLCLPPIVRSPKVVRWFGRSWDQGCFGVVARYAGIFVCGFWGQEVCNLRSEKGIFFDTGSWNVLGPAPCSCCRILGPRMSNLRCTRRPGRSWRLCHRLATLICAFLVLLGAPSKAV